MTAESDETIRLLLEAEPLRRPTLRAIVDDLGLPAGSRGLDVGCGIGLQAQLLADAVGESGRVVGLDVDPQILAHGSRLARDAGLSGRIEFVEGSMSALPLEDDAFDWLWSADCAGYPSADLAALLPELTRVLRPGGLLALAGWTSQRVLPGRDATEAMLDATCSSYLPYLRGRDPRQHFMHAARGLREAGLDDVRASTSVRDLTAPLTDDERTGLASLFEMLWLPPGPDAGEPATSAWLERERLCTPGSPDYVLDDPGYYGFFTYSVFRGRKL
jgi:SAM-dependent methyltransferase